MQNVEFSGFICGFCRILAEMTEKTCSISVRLSAIGDLCASCTLVHRVQFKQKRCFKAFFFLGGRKYGRRLKTAF